MGWDRDKLRAAAAALAQGGVFIGTSSWKYAGWQGQIYERDRYIWRGRFSEARFERLCLGEYAETFKTVCVDAAYYKFPEERQLGKMVSQVPADFLFTLKVTDEITSKHFANLPRFGARAGRANRNFLNAELFESAFLGPCKAFQKNMGLLIFEFSRFFPGDFARGREFVEALDKFLARLPSGWRYGVEIRNKEFLHPEYFCTLARYGVAHIFNSWQDMPALDEQWALPSSRTAAEFFGARLLLMPGRKYEEAVKLFRPYDTIKDPYPEGRAAGVKMIKSALSSGARTRGFIYVNNRFEGNAIETIGGMVEEGEGKAPSTKIQDPEKLQTSNIKQQAEAKVGGRYKRPGWISKQLTEIAERN